MDFVTSHFGKMKLWPVEHRLNTFSTYLSSKLDSPLIKTLERIRFSSNQNIGEGESNFDDKYVEKSVQLVRGSSFRNDLLQNLYFNNNFFIILCIFDFQTRKKSQLHETSGLIWHLINDLYLKGQTACCCLILVKAL